MASSEERREVAERLRAYPWELTKLCHTDPLKWVGDIMYDLMDIVGAGEDADSLFPAIADLIDPTCHVVTVEDESGDRTEVHDCCGDQHTRDAFSGEPFAHCPGCGARVVNGNE